MAYSLKAYHGYNIYLSHGNIVNVVQSQMKPWMSQMAMCSSTDYLLHFRLRHEIMLKVFVSKDSGDDRCASDETILADGAKTKAITLQVETGYCSALNISNPKHGGMRVLSLAMVGLVFKYCCFRFLEPSCFLLSIG